MIALSTRAALIAGASALVLLTSSYGLGYWKGKKGRPAPTTVTDRQIDSKKTENERKVSVQDVTSDRDIEETRLTLPDIVMPDGSRKSQVRITRKVVGQTTVDATTNKETEVKVVERVVEKKVMVPGPPGECPPPLANPFSEPARARFSIGPTVGRNLDTSKTVYGGAAGLRVLGPVWLRVGADSNPSVHAGAEVQF